MALRIPKLRGYRGAKVKTHPKGATQKSSVVHCQIHPEAIMIVFKEHGGEGAEHTYLYTYESCGDANVEHMKDLARRGSGLNRFINEQKPPYSLDAALYGYTPTRVRRGQEEVKQRMGYPYETSVNDFSFVLPGESTPEEVAYDEAEFSESEVVTNFGTLMDPNYGKARGRKR